MLESRRSLPTYKEKDAILNAISKNQVPYRVLISCLLNATFNFSSFKTDVTNMKWVYSLQIVVILILR